MGLPIVNIKIVVRCFFLFAVERSSNDRKRVTTRLEHGQRREKKLSVLWNSKRGANVRAMHNIQQPRAISH